MYIQLQELWLVLVVLHVCNLEQIKIDQDMFPACVGTIIRRRVAATVTVVCMYTRTVHDRIKKPLAFKILHKGRNQMDDLCVSTLEGVCVASMDGTPSFLITTQGTVEEVVREVVWTQAAVEKVNDRFPFSRTGELMSVIDWVPSHYRKCVLFQKTLFAGSWSWTKMTWLLSLLSSV